MRTLLRKDEVLRRTHEARGTNEHYALKKYIKIMHSNDGGIVMRDRKIAEAAIRAAFPPESKPVEPKTGVAYIKNGVPMICLTDCGTHLMVYLPNSDTLTEASFFGATYATDEQIEQFFAAQK